MKRDILLLPILQNPKYFVFMYILGAICIFTTGNKTYIPYYLKLYAELFLDLYISCCLLTLVNTKARKCITVFLYIILYLTAIIDIFCFIRIGSTLSPSILRLIFETNSKEASEFINTYINTKLFLSPLGVILLLCIYQISTQKTGRMCSERKIGKQHRITLNVIVVCILAIGCQSSLTNKRNMFHLYNMKSLNEIEDYLGSVSYARRANYIPIYRLSFSLYANYLAIQQISRMTHTLQNTFIDECNFTSPNIILIIGESYNRNHSQLRMHSEASDPQIPLSKESPVLYTEWIFH